MSERDDDLRSFKLLVLRPDYLAAPTVQVQVDTYFRPAERAGQKGLICLTLDAASPREFDADIDDLIAELQALKPKARRVFAAEAARVGESTGTAASDMPRKSSP